MMDIQKSGREMDKYIITEAIIQLRFQVQQIEEMTIHLNVFKE